MTTYRVGIVGCRARGSVIAAAYHAHPRTEIVGVCDLVAELRDELADRHGVAGRFDSLDTMVRATAPDIVVIATGTEYHYDLATAALGHGCHVDVEKPLGRDLVEADIIVRLARELDRKVAVHHQTRVGAYLRALKELLDAGRIGKLIALRATDKGYYGGLGLMNIGTHLINAMLHVAGHVRAISAMATTGGHPIEPDDVLQAPLGMGVIAGDHITALLEFDHDVHATLEHRRYPTVDGNLYGVEMLGTEGRLKWKNNGAWHLPVAYQVPGTADWAAVEPKRFPADTDEGRGDELWYVEELVQAIDQDRAHPCSAVEGMHALEVMMGIFESAATRRRLELPQPQRDHPLLRWRKEHRLGPPAEAPRDYGAWLKAEQARIDGLVAGGVR